MNIGHTVWCGCVSCEMHTSLQACSRAQSLVSLLYTPVACLVITCYISMVYQLPIESASSEGILLTEQSAVYSAQPLPL